MVMSTRNRARLRTMPMVHKQRLIDMPLDVLIEIFLFLEPLDLLYLSRVTKELRRFLLDRWRSSVLWKNAIGNVDGLPPCPDHMSAPAYTYLAFVPVCHGCFCPCETVEWELRMRCCPDCFPKLTIPRGSSRRGMLCDRLDLPCAATHWELRDVFDLEITVCAGRIYWPPSLSLSDLIFAQLRKRPRKLAVEAFIDQQNDFWRSVQRHARSCRDWEYKRLEEKAVQLSRVRKQRVEDIKHKLEELGWTEPLICDASLMKLPQVRKLEPLTSTEWTKIRPRLISWAQEAKKASIWNQCKTIFMSVASNVASNTSLKVQPREIDVAMLPAVRSVFESAINSNTNHDDLEKKLHRVLPPAIRKWSKDAVKELEQFAQEQLGLLPHSNPSRLPSVIFRCTRSSQGIKCNRRLGFDKALSHSHLYKEKDEDERDDISEMSTYDKIIMGYYTHPRNIRVLQVDVTVSRRVENLIKRMGQNPSRVTYDQLRHSIVNVACNLCRRGEATGMYFEYAFEHCLNTHLRGKETEIWTRISAKKVNDEIISDVKL